MYSLVGPINTGAAVGGNGVATANKTLAQPVSGLLVGLYVRYNDSPPATTDVVVSTSGASAPAYTILTLTDKNTSGWFFPRITACDQLGVALAGANTEVPIIADTVKVLIDGANAADSVDVWLLMV